MIRPSARALLCAIAAALVPNAQAQAEILRCEAAIQADYDRNLRLDIVLPESYDKELAMVDALTGETDVIAQNEFLGHRIRKGLSIVDIRVDPGSGEFNPPRRHHFIITTGPEVPGMSLIGVFISDSMINSGMPGMFMVDYEQPTRDIMVIDSTHLPGVLSVYKGTCE